jgi:hypothetical protein
MKRTTVLLTVLAAFGALALVASAAPTSASLMIRHQVHGCHAWSLNGGKFLAVQRIQLARGGSILITNNDVMPHQVVRTSGPAIVVKLISRGMAMGVPSNGVGMMSHMSAAVKVTFPAKGVYKLMTKAGEDYMEGMKTTGEDNVLRAIVTVS